MKKIYGLLFLLSTNVIANPVPLVVDSFSSTDFTGTSSASGTVITTTNHSTVNFEDQSTAGNAFISLDASSILNFAQTTSSTYSGQLSGTGTVQKTGTGALTISGNNATFTGPLDVLTGTLFLEGNYGGSVSVAPSANISYGGTVSGNLNVNNGTITTNGTKTLVVNGNYSQSNQAIYIVNVNSSGQSSLITIGGTATIAGFVEVDTSGGVLRNHQYTILHANGGVTGTYSLLDVPPTLNLFITYDPNNVYLSFISNFAGPAVTPNEREVGLQLNTIDLPTPDENIVLNALTQLDTVQAQNALDALSGEQYSTFILATLYGDSQFAQKLFDAYRNILNPCAAQCEDVQNWVSTGAGRGFQHTSNGAPGFKLTNFDVSTGMHSCFKGGWLLGGALGYEADFVHSKLAGKATLETGQAAIYSAYQNKHLYVLSNVIGARTWSDYKRPIDFGTIHRTAKSKPRLTHGRVDLEVGGNVGTCRLRFQPFIGGSAEIYHQNKIKEHGAQSINLDIESLTKHLFSSKLGMHINSNPNKLFNLDLDLAWQHYYGKMSVSETTTFTEFGTPFVIEGPKRGHDGGLGALFLSIPLNTAWDIYAEAAGEVWKHWHAYEFSAGVAYRW